MADPIDNRARTAEDWASALQWQRERADRSEALAQRLERDAESLANQLDRAREQLAYWQGAALYNRSFSWCQVLGTAALVLEAGRCGYAMAWATASLGRPADGLDHIDATVRKLMELGR